MILSKTNFYRVWVEMKRRCNAKNRPNYKDYGARGIRVCEGWLEFKGFYEDMYSSYKQGLSLDRIDNNKGYCKENCRWATKTESNQNKRTTKVIEYMGIRDFLPNWAKFFGMKRDTLYSRLYRKNWSIEQAFFTPIKQEKVKYYGEEGLPN